MQKLRPNNYQFFKTLIGLYFFAAGICCFLYYIMTQRGGIFTYILPNLITTLVFLTYISSSYLYARDTGKIWKRDFFSIILLLQSLQLEINGFVFKNFYFPNLSIKIDFRNLSDISMNFSYFSLKIINGYFPNNNNFIVSINLFLIMVILIISGLFIRRERVKG